MLYREADPRRPGVILVTPEGAGARLEKRAEGAAAEGGIPKIVGQGVVYEQETELFPGYVEVIHKGAATKTLKEADVRGLFNHSPDYLLARSKSETLRLRETAEGVEYEMDPLDVGWVRDRVIAPMERGDLDGSSFAFKVVRDAEERRPDDTIVRHVREVEMFDVSVVTFPQYEGAGAGLRMQVRNAMSVGRSERDVLHAIFRASGLTAAEIRATMESVIEELHPPKTASGAAVRSIDKARRRLELAAREA